MLPTIANRYTAFEISHLCLEQIHYEDIAQQVKQFLIDIPDKSELVDIQTFINSLHSLFNENRRRRLAKEVPEFDNLSFIDQVTSEYDKLSFSIMKRCTLPHDIYNITLELIDINKQQNIEEGVSDKLLPISGSKFR